MKTFHFTFLDQETEELLWSDVVTGGNGKLNSSLKAMFNSLASKGLKVSLTVWTSSESFATVLLANW